MIPKILSAALHPYNNWSIYRFTQYLECKAQKSHRYLTALSYSAA